MALSATPAAVRAQGGVAEGTCKAYPQALGAGQWQSVHAYYKSGRMIYPADGESNRIPDYSYAGYKYGQVDLPSVPRVASLTPVTGDNTSHIQQALDRVGKGIPNANGFRGALVLAPGVYEIAGAIHINQSGVVLRGSGDGDNPASNTILRITGTDRRTPVTLGSSTNWVETTLRTNITTAFVQVGSKSFQVETVSGFALGDAIIVRHPSTQAWIDAVDKGGGKEGVWKVGGMDIPYYRVITGLSGNTVTMDAPIYNHLDRKLSQSYIAMASWNPVRESGVENLRIDIVTKGGEDEDHAANGMQVRGCRNCWVRKVTALHFTYAGVRMESAVQTTVDSSRALDPVGIRTGGRFYNFANDRYAQLNLIQYCHVSGARHGYVSNGMSTASGLVYYRNTAENGGGSEGGHRNWTTGVLYDNIQEAKAGQILFINRGDAGSTTQGWSAAHSTIWKYNSELVVQKPPTAQNYGITNSGHFRTKYYNPGPGGIQELKTGELIPTSLYEAQICERLQYVEPPIMASKVLMTGNGAGMDKRVSMDGRIALPPGVAGTGKTVRVYDLRGNLVYQAVASGDYLQLPPEAAKNRAVHMLRISDG